ncbi:MAG: hypothetical protein HY587_07110 [Candidatus Omnitrophica bacterium]|nr:hypothetical protein [Candidatus Omnitrophota bacterium]
MRYRKAFHSPIEHLAKTVSLSSFDWREVIFAMFTACFDAGGSQHDQKFLVVAGFVSSAEEWVRFDKAWRERLAGDNLSYFHMVDFAQFSGEFRNGWRDNEPRRKKLLSDLVEIIRRHAFRRFGCAIDNEVFLRNLPENRRRQYFLNAYALAGMTSAAQVFKWCKEERTPFEKVDFVFEDGDIGKGQLITRFNNDLGMTPVFKPKKDKQATIGMVFGFTPLQAADFLAYEITKGCKEMKNRKRDPRWGLEELLKIPGPLGTYDPENLEALDVNHQALIKTSGWFNKLYGKKS